MDEEERKSEDFTDPENYKMDYRKGQGDFHKGPTILSQLDGFDCVKDVIIDNMHAGYGVADKVTIAL